MVALSKFFQNHIQAVTCQELLHSGSCREQFLKNILLYPASNFKYFVPFSIIPILIKLHSMNKTKLLKALKHYVECSLVGSAVGCTIACCICLFRNLLGHFGFYTFVFVPTAIGASMLNLGSKRVQELFKTSVFQCNVDTFFIMRRNFISRLIADSRILQTCIFMLCSAIILQGKHLYNIEGFWILEPNPKLAEVENPDCSECELHPKESCQRYLFDGMRKYFLLGLSLDMVKALTSKVKAGSNQSKLLGKVNNFRIRSTAMLTVNIGIYRFMHCLLQRHFPNEHILNHITSGFLAGICYTFYPQSNLLSFALVRAIQTLWTILQIKTTNTEYRSLRFLLRLPIGNTLFHFALGNIVHLVCLKPEYCSRLSSNIANGITNNCPVQISNGIRKIQQKLNKDMVKSSVQSM